MHTWIGYAHPDRLLSYPDAAYLSGCSLPIRMLLIYPDVCWWPGAATPPAPSALVACSACCAAGRPPTGRGLTRPLPRTGALQAARTGPLCAEEPQAQRKRGPAPADPRPNRSYSWSPPRPRGVIWGHSRSMDASRPCLRRYFSKSSAQSWWAWSW